MRTCLESEPQDLGELNTVAAILYPRVQYHAGDDVRCDHHNPRCNSWAVADLLWEPENVSPVCFPHLINWVNAQLLVPDRPDEEEPEEADYPYDDRETE